MSAVQPSQDVRAGRILALIFAFSAWLITGPASTAHGLLLLLFLAEIPRHWEQLRRDPALWLVLGALALTSILAVRAAILFPQTANDQWHAILAWTAPLSFIALAWWIRGAPDLVWRLLVAAFLGLVIGVLRRTDGSLVPQILEGMRYHFDYATNGLAFIASVCLVALLLLRRRITGIIIAERTRPILGWLAWGLALAFVLIILVVTQSRGAALILAFAGLSYAALEWLAPRSVLSDTPIRRWTLLLFVTSLILIAGALLWTMKHRQQYDLEHIIAAQTTGHLGYDSSPGARINLYRVGAAVIAERPLLGWGPGTSSTEFVIPQNLVTLDPIDREHAVDFSHLHSVALEIPARFGLPGVLFTILALVVMLRAHFDLWSNPRVPADLRVFLAVTGLMTLVFCTYEFRVVHTELRFFLILYLGIVYGLSLDGQGSTQGKGL